MAVNEKKQSFQGIHGFSLIDMAIILVIVGSLLVVVIGIVPHYLRSLSLQENKVLLAKADRSVQGFAISHARLPCPDTTGDGVENCVSVVGTLPWKTLGLPAPTKDANFLKLRYAAYHNAVATANLTILNNTYAPAVPNGAAAPNHLNGLDFCQGLANAGLAAFSAQYAYAGSGATQRNVAYAIAVSGFGNADNLTGAFDGVHTGASPAFATNNKVRDYVYDDLVVVRDFSTLSVSLSCEHLINSMGVMSEVYDYADGVKGNAIDARNGLIQAVAMDAVATALVAVDAVIAGFDVASATAALGVSTGLLAGATAACVAVVGCPLVPVYTSAVTLGNLAIAAAVVALGLQVAAVASQTAITLARAAALTAAVIQEVTTTGHAAATAAWLDRMDLHGAVH